MNLRIGQGYDVHQLGEGHELWIGGILIPADYGSIGHSDGDVLIHAICDAMLGALNLRDIGYHFPDNDPDLKGIDSKILLEKTCQIIQKKGYIINNIDSTVCLQKVKLKNHIPTMISKLSEVLQISEDQVSVKATTTERLGFVGREEGIEAQAIVLLTKKEK